MLALKLSDRFHLEEIPISDSSSYQPTVVTLHRPRALTISKKGSTAPTTDGMHSCTPACATLPLLHRSLQRHSSFPPSMQRNLDTKLYTACEQGLKPPALQVVQSLLAQGASVNAVCSGSNTPVHAAAISGSAAVLNAVTASDQNADLNACNDWGLTPLLAAVDMAPSNSAGDYAGVVNLLLTRGADHTLGNERGETALQLAAEYLLLDVVNSFLNTHARGSSQQQH